MPATPIAERLALLPQMHLSSGGHDKPLDFGAPPEACLFEATAWLVGDDWTDRPRCVSPVLGDFGRSLNDRLDDGLRQRLLPFAEWVVNTAGDGLDETRGYMALDWLIRTYTPAWLDLANLSEEAAALRSLRRIVDLAAAKAAGPVVRVGREKAAVAWDAARYAAGDAALDAAGDAAGDAARYAAWDAALDAAGDAARYAAGDAALDAARYAAWDAALGRREGRPQADRHPTPAVRDRPVRPHDHRPVGRRSRPVSAPLWKATAPSGHDFRTGTVDYAAALTSGKVLSHPTSSEIVPNEPATYLSVSAEPAETLIGGSWPCRLFRVEAVGDVVDRLAVSPHKRAVLALRVVEEVEGWRALGPNGRQAAAIIARAALLTRDEIHRLAAAGDAARYAAGDAALDAAGDAAGDAARYAAWDAALDAAGAAAALAAGDAAGAAVVRDLITPEQYDQLAGPWESVVGPITSAATWDEIYGEDQS